MRNTDVFADLELGGIGDLALVLGGDETSFTGDLLRLIAKADPDNRQRLRLAFPRQVQAWETWMSMRPTPTGKQLLDALARRPGGMGDPDRRMNVESRLLAVISTYGGQQIIAGPPMERMTVALADAAEALAEEGYLLPGRGSEPGA